MYRSESITQSYICLKKSVSYLNDLPKNGGNLLISDEDNLIQEKVNLEQLENKLSDAT